MCSLAPPPSTPEDVEDGMVILQALVEGMVLEVHVTNRQGLQTEATNTPLVEIYTQFGSQVCDYITTILVYTCETVFCTFPCSCKPA